MSEIDIILLEDNGWVVECESPFEISHSETESFAKGYAAQLVLDSLKNEADTERRTIVDLAIRFCSSYNKTNNTYNKITSLMDFGCLGKTTPEYLISKFYYLFKEEGLV